MCVYIYTYKAYLVTQMVNNLPAMQDTHTHNRILLNHKKNEIMPFAATQLELEVSILVEYTRERQILYDITYMWNLKHDSQMNLFTKHKQSHRHRKQTSGWQRED